MKKILFVATIHKHFLAFHIPYIKLLKEKGYEVHVAANGDNEVPYVDKQFKIDIQRSPFSLKNITAYKQLKKIIETEKYDLITCHTAMGGVIARLAGKGMRNTGVTKILYTAHGFHFFKGAPLKYWLLYYPVEKYLSKYTDGIVTINQEDYDLVRTHHFKNIHTYKIHGIGINIERLKITNNELKLSLRKEYGYDDKKFILIYIAEYIERKNHKFIIESIKDLSSKIQNIKVLFAGRGRLMEEMKSYSSTLGVDQYIDFLGFRKDIGNLIDLSDVGISASKQEGLPLNLAEEMYCGIPVIASRIRGHCDLIKNGYNGFLYSLNDKSESISFVCKLYNDNKLREEMGNNSKVSMIPFLIENSLKEMENIYNKYL